MKIPKNIFEPIIEEKEEPVVIPEPVKVIEEPVIEAKPEPVIEEEPVQIVPEVEPIEETTIIEEKTC